MEDRWNNNTITSSFLASRLNNTSYVPSKKQTQPDSADLIGRIIWKTWVQENYFSGRYSGQYVATTTKKLAKRLFITTAEDFVRAQFVMGTQHIYLEGFHFRFTHLINDRCERAYSDFLHGREEYVERRIWLINTYLKEWLKTREVEAELIFPYHTEDRFMKIFIYEYKNAAGEKQTLDEKRLNTYCSTVAIECLRYPDLLKAPFWKVFPASFERVKQKFTEFKEEIYGENYGITIPKIC